MRERRVHPRLEEENSVAVKVLGSPEAKSLEGKTFFCTSEDISVGGLRFPAPEAVPVDGRLELRVAFVDPPDAFLHIGRVAWVQSDHQDFPFVLGVEFVDTPGERLEEWKRVVDVKLKDKGPETE